MAVETETPVEENQPIERIEQDYTPVDPAFEEEWSSAENAMARLIPR